MARAWYLSGLVLLVGVLVAIRLTLPPLGLPGPFLGRLDVIGFAVWLAIVAVTALAVLRLRDAGLSLFWGVPIFLWLAACELPIRALLGGRVEWSGYPGPVTGWAEIPLMLIAFLAFLALVERHPGGQATLVAAVAATVATLFRPFLFIGGLDRLPVLGDLIGLSSPTLTWLLHLEYWFTALKGLFFLPDWAGNAILVIAFAGGLIAMLAAARAGDDWKAPGR